MEVLDPRESLEEANLWALANSFSFSHCFSCLGMKEGGSLLLMAAALVLASSESESLPAYIFEDWLKNLNNSNNSNF